MQNLKEICYSPNLNPIPNPDLLFLSADGGQVKFHACLESISVAAQCAAGGAVRFIHFPTLNAATHSGDRTDAVALLPLSPPNSLSVKNRPSNGME